MRSPRRIPARLGLVIVAAAVLVAACSGGDDDPTVEANNQPTPTPLATQPTPEPTTDPEPATDPEAALDDVGEPGSETDEPADGDTEPTPPPDIDLSVPAFTEASKISTVGLDEIFFGMTADQAAAAADTAWDADGSTTGQCWFATPLNGPVGVEFMIWNGSVERVDITTELITTRSGAGVGSTPDELRALFGDLLDESDPAQLAFVPTDEGDAEFRIFFEITDGAVSSYRAGRLPMVEFPACP